MHQQTDACADEANSPIDSPLDLERREDFGRFQVRTERFGGDITVEEVDIKLIDRAPHTWDVQVDATPTTGPDGVEYTYSVTIRLDDIALRDRRLDSADDERVAGYLNELAL